MALFIGAAFFILGAIVASFVGALVDRYQTGQSVLSGRSRCDRCGAPLAPHTLVPLFSYLALGGRARCCGARVSGASTLAEAGLGALYALAAFSLGASLALPFFLAALAALLALVRYDLRHQILPPAFLAAFLPSAALAGFFADPSAFGLRFVVAAAVALFFALLNLTSRGRWMGSADAPLSFGLALLVGPAASLPGFVFSFWIGAVVGIGMLLARPAGSRMGVEVPLAPFLAAGFLLAYFTQWDPVSIVAALL